MWGIIAVVVVVVVVLVALVAWHSSVSAYLCRRCGNEFTITAFLDFVSPHGVWLDGGWKLLRCPRCRHWTRAKVIRRDDMGSTGIT